MPAEPKPPANEGTLPFVTNPIKPPSARSALYGNVKQKSNMLPARKQFLACHEHALLPAVALKPHKSCVQLVTVAQCVTRPHADHSDRRPRSSSAMSGRYAHRGRRGGGRLATGQRPVSESNRIDIAEQLAQFQASDKSGTHMPTFVLLAAHGLFHD